MKIWHIFFLPFNGVVVGLLHTMKFFKKSFVPSTLYKYSIVGLRVTAKYDSESKLPLLSVIPVDYPK